MFEEELRKTAISLRIVGEWTDIRTVSELKPKSLLTDQTVSCPDGFNTPIS
jgi:hypothetical protein